MKCLKTMLLLLPCGMAVAAELRDPTQPPAAAQTAMAASSPASDAADAAATTPRHLIVSKGRSYVVEHGQRYGVGDTLGNATIQRIDGDAVWLQDTQGTRRVPLYVGVSKRPALENGASFAPEAARTDRKQSSNKEAP